MSAPTTMRRDIASSYAVSGARVLSWVIVSAMLFRDSAADFALFALVRATIGILQYTSLGLAPAMVYLLAQARRSEIPLARIAPSVEVPVVVQTPAPGAAPLSYETPPRIIEGPTINPALRSLFANGVIIALLTTLVGAVVTILYAMYFDLLHEMPSTGSSGGVIAAALGISMLLRLASDAGGAVIQTEGRIWLDNIFLVAGEIAWVAMTAFVASSGGRVISGATAGFVLAGVVVFYARMIAADQHTRLPSFFWRYGELRVAAKVLRLGALITLAQLANYLYAPTDFILINWLIDPLAVATYAPAVQIDAGLLLLVSGLAAVLLPKSAVAHAAGDVATLRRYYVRGTRVSILMLAGVALMVWAASPVIFQVWLGNDMAATCAILPFVLIHTVIGGSGSVGRSILIGAGRVKPLTAAVLVAAVANVILSYCTVRYLGWGLYGIVFGTICAAVGCFGVWMPWYVMRTLRQMENGQIDVDIPPPPATP